MKTRFFTILTSVSPVILLGALAFGTAAAADGDAAATAEAGTFDWRAFLAPFHSVVLHLPIGFVTIAFILEVYALFFNRGASLRRAVGFVLWISAISAIVASMFGFLRSGGGGYEKQALAFHQWTGIAVTVVTGLTAFLHLFAFSKEDKRRPVLAFGYRVILLINVGLLSIAGHYGGNLTHGSKYLFENAPEWVSNWVEETEAKVTEKIEEETGLDLGADEPDGISADTDSAGGGVYAESIRPIFEEKCFQCHGPEKQKGKYRMDTTEGLFAAGDSELDPIVDGRPLESYLVEVITLPTDDDFVMPPSGKEPLTPDETLTIMRWIWDGADTGEPETAAE